MNKTVIFILFSLLFAYKNSYSQEQKRLDSARFYFDEGLKNDALNQHAIAFENYMKAKLLFRKARKDSLVEVTNLQIFKLLDSQNNLGFDAIDYLNSYDKYARQKRDTVMLITSNYFFASYYFDSDQKEISTPYYRKTLDYAKRIGRKKTEANVYSNMALLYTKTEPDSASYFFKKALSLYGKENKYELYLTYINYANFFQNQEKYSKSIEQLKKAEKIDPGRNKLKLKKILYTKFYKNYKEVNEYKNSIRYLELSIKYEDSLNNHSQNIAIKDLDKKYQLNEKDLTIDLLEDKVKKVYNNLTIVIVLIVLIGGTISYLTIKNSRRKRLLALQEKELETQKNLTLLKEQEINSINAMVEGQEKERKRVAEDLHDNLGSVIATLKLHFDNLRFNRKTKKIDQETLFDKTEGLIDEAYKKVRSIAHAKNAGVIANQGLLVAVQMMAEKISSANTIQIEVIHYGLEKPIENSLEISLFRIIQELTTNIIKHAKAEHATINISQDQDDITILIEDNGVGMNTSQIDSKKGMGIHSIKARVEHLEGHFTIDSTPSKGTTVIINIPV